MRRRVQALATLFVALASLLTPLYPAVAPAQQPAPFPATQLRVVPSQLAAQPSEFRAQPGTTISILDRSAEIDRLLRDGRRMERDRRWGEALSHYEDALRRYPGEDLLHRRFDETRLHYDLSRRYDDRTFREKVARLPFDAAVDLYGEVLLKVQTHYVEAPHFSELLEDGAHALEVALKEDRFAAEHLSGVGSGSVERFVVEMWRQLSARNVRTRLDATDAASEVAQLAQSRLGCPATAALLEFLCGATNTLDAYSAYLTPGQLNEVYAQIEGNFVGLGVELKADDGNLLIVRVIPGSPAQKAGVLAGDRIVAVDGKSTAEMTTDQAADLLQGEEGSRVRLSVATPGQRPRTLDIRRVHVDVPSIDQVKMLDPVNGVGYFRLTCFQKTTAADLDAALWRLHRQGMRRLIIDLRGNPGGLLVTAVEVVDKFVPQGVIVSTRGRAAQEDFTYTANAPGTWRVPLVVLIDGDSASAAEIFAGAIRDHRRGTVVGERSYGKGSVQGIFPLSTAETGIRLTTAKFYSPAGHPYSHVGVDPDVRVHTAARPIHGQVSIRTAESDPILAAGLEAARRASMPRWAAR